MRIYIPSLERADRRVLEGPAPQISGLHEVIYVVPRSQIKQYITALMYYRVRARVIVCDEVGIAATRRWIGEHARLQNVSKFLMADDDIQFLVRKADDTWQLRKAEKNDTDEMLSWIDATLDVHVHVGVSAREGNNTAGIGDHNKLVSFNTRTIRALAYRTDAFLSVEHERVPVMEDFDVNLQLLRRGGSNVATYFWAQGQRMTNEVGGCSTYRSHEVHEASAKRLAELHPLLVSLCTKVNKTDREGFGTRTEVTIQWKRAWMEGQKSAPTP